MNKLINEKLTDDILRLVKEERARQDGGWGTQHHSKLYWLGVLMEELGEAAKNAIESPTAAAFCEELIQVAAVCVAAVEDYVAAIGGFKNDGN